MPIKNIYPGKFIVFEGIDGSGKGTIAKAFCGYFKDDGYDVLDTFEPTIESVAGKKAENFLQGKNKVKIKPARLQELFILDRFYHVKKVIIPALMEGKIVVCDRYFFSTLAYGIATGVGKEWLYQKHAEILKDKWILPDAVIFIDTFPEIAAQRMKGRKKEYFDKKKTEFAKKVRTAYLETFRDFSDIVYRVDGDGTFEEVFEEVKKIVFKILRK